MMKRTLLVLSGVLLFMAATVPAAAQTAPAATPAGSSIEQRLTQRKAERVIKLEDKDKKRLTTTCKAAQLKIRTLQNGLITIFDKRSNTYQRIDGKLWVAIGELKLAEKDTFELEKTRAQLAEKTAVFATTVKEYQQVLDDSTVINCESDPEGFKAFLETAKLYQEQIRKQSADIKSFVVDTVKKVLAGHVTDLQPKQSTEN